MAYRSFGLERVGGRYMTSIMISVVGTVMIFKEDGTEFRRDFGT